MPDSQPSRTEWCQRALRVFASQTNLLVASSRVLVLGAGPLADELARALGTMGARVAAGGAGARIPAETDLVFATGEELSALTPAAIEAWDPDAGIPVHPVVIVDAAPPGQNPAVDLTAFAVHPAVPARDQIRGFALGREVFVLTISEVAVAATVDSALSAVRA